MKRSVYIWQLNSVSRSCVFIFRKISGFSPVIPSLSKDKHFTLIGDWKLALEQSEWCVCLWVCVLTPWLQGQVPAPSVALQDQQIHTITNDFTRKADRSEKVSVYQLLTLVWNPSILRGEESVKCWGLTTPSRAVWNTWEMATALLAPSEVSGCLIFTYFL